MMDKGSFERRRLLQFIALGSLAAPAVALAACESDSGNYQPPPRFHHEGNDGGDKAGGRR
jgi:hypothetical protein